MDKYTKKNIKTMDCRHSFEVKKMETGTFIQGWANKAVVDRGKDLIKMDAWNLDNFKKVPTILFNHDKDKPIGKCVDVRATEQGLWIKAKISNSNDPTISMVRDLINEGMLNAFSVGFEAGDEQQNSDGINEIKSAELYETSVVTLPMNQDSTFECTTKSLVGLSKDKAISKILKAKGAWVAEAAHGKIYEMEKAGEKRDDLISKIANASGLNKDGVTQVLAGNVNPVPEKVLSAISEVLGMAIDEIKKIEAGDKEDMKDNQDTADKVAIIGMTIPKDQAQDADAAAALVQDAGYNVIEVQETDSGWYVLQNDPSLFGEETATLDMGDGVIATVGVRKAAEGEKAAPVPDKEETQPPEDKNPTPAPADKKPVPPHPAEGHQAKPTIEPKPEGNEPPKADANETPASDASQEPTESGDSEQAKQDYEQFKQDQDSNSTPEWVANEELWNAAKKASEEAVGKNDYAFVVWWYLQNGGSKKAEARGREKGLNDAPISGGGDATMPIDDNPYLAQARQTNVLLGVLIEEFRTMCAAMQGGAVKEVAAPAKTDEQQQEDDPLQKQVVSNLKTYLKSLEDKLKAIGA